MSTPADRMGEWLVHTYLPQFVSTVLSGVLLPMLLLVVLAVFAWRSWSGVL
jgi:ABC-type transport system involved in cytochrome bd biosynthesis fused ATPase/permease subunit